MGVLAGIASLLFGFLFAMGVSTGPPIRNHPGFIRLINAEGYWFLACTLLLPIAIGWQGKAERLSTVIGWTALGLGGITGIYWVIVSNTVSFPRHYNGSIAIPALFLSACLGLAGGIRLWRLLTSKRDRH